jgi:NAD(P)H dehydrogenase (quinone)
MEILVVYYSKSGNTAKLAEEVGKGVQEVEGAVCRLKSVEEVANDDFVSASGIIAGSPVYYGSMAAELKAVFDRLLPVRKKMGNKVGAAFCTSGHHTGGKETTMLSILQAMLINGMVVVGDPLDASGHYGAACSGTPDAVTASVARKLGKRVAQLARSLHTSAE